MHHHRQVYETCAPLFVLRHRIWDPHGDPSVTATGAGRLRTVMGSSIFCGVAQIAVRRSHKPVGGGASPPATSTSNVVSTGVRPSLISSGDLADYRERLGPTPRTTTRLPVARGISGTVLRTRIAVARLHSRVPSHTHADGISAPALRRRVASVRLTPWVPFRR